MFRHNAHFALFQRFTAAEDRCKTFSDSCFNLLIYSFVCFSEIFTSFRMTDDNVFNAKVQKHISRNFTCESTAFFPVHIFSTNCNVCTLCHFCSDCKICCRCADNNIYISVSNHRDKFFNKISSL